MFHEVLCSIFLGYASNLTDHNNSLGFRVGQENLEAVDEVGAVERITTDANAQGLTQTNLKQQLKIRNTDVRKTIFIFGIWSY